MPSADQQTVRGIQRGSNSAFFPVLRELRTAWQAPPNKWGTANNVLGPVLGGGVCVNAYGNQKDPS